MLEMQVCRCTYHYLCGSSSNLFVFFTLATEGVDFTVPSPFQVVFGTDSSPGNTQTETITINTDQIIEGEEVFVVMVTNISPAGDVSGSNSATVSITDSNCEYVCSMCVCSFEGLYVQQKVMAYSSSTH